MLVIMHVSFIVMLVIKGFLVINCNVRFPCLFSPSSYFFFFFFWPVIVPGIPRRCSGTHPIGLGTKATEKLLKACQPYLPWISRVLRNAESSRAGPGGVGGREGTATDPFPKPNRSRGRGRGASAVTASAPRHGRRRPQSPNLQAQTAALRVFSREK